MAHERVGRAESATPAPLPTLPNCHFGRTNPHFANESNGRKPVDNAPPPGDFDFRAPGAPFPFFLLPCTQGKWSAGRRRVLARHPGEPCEGPPRALRGRAHPNDVGVRRLPALHRDARGGTTFFPC